MDICHASGDQDMANTWRTSLLAQCRTSDWSADHHPPPPTIVYHRPPSSTALFVICAGHCEFEAKQSRRSYWVEVLAELLDNVGEELFGCGVKERRAPLSLLSSPFADVLADGCRRQRMFPFASVPSSGWQAAISSLFAPRVVRIRRREQDDVQRRHMAQWCTASCCLFSFLCRRCFCLSMHSFVGW